MEAWREKLTRECLLKWDKLLTFQNHALLININNSPKVQRSLWCGREESRSMFLCYHSLSQSSKEFFRRKWTTIAMDKWIESINQLEVCKFRAKTLIMLIVYFLYSETRQERVMRVYTGRSLLGSRSLYTTKLSQDQRECTSARQISGSISGGRCQRCAVHMDLILRQILVSLRCRRRISVHLMFSLSR